MRILQISSARNFGGGERHFVDLTNGLIRSGHELFVAVRPDSPILPELQRVPEPNVLRLPFRKPFDLASAWRVRRFAREHELQIIHAHRARDYPFAAVTAGKSGPRLILTRHVVFPMNNLHKLTRSRAARVIAVSEAVAMRLREQKIFGEHQIAVVRNGIDVGRFSLPAEQRESKLLRVGILGELSPVKGQIDFIHAAAMVCARRDDVQFILAGRDHSDDGRHGRELRAAIESAGLNDRIQIIESTVDVAEFLAHLDVFVSASRSEAFGLAIVEAMAAGAAVVATATDGAAEILSDGRTGRLCPAGDVQALAAGIDELLADEAQRKRLAENARAAAIENYSVERMVAETEAVYRGALDK